MRQLFPTLTALVALACAAPAPGRGQTLPWDARGGFGVGGEAERYLRVLELTGAARHRPATIRTTAPVDPRHLPLAGRDHPWAARFRTSEPDGGLQGGLIRPELSVLYNSAFPFGENDGPVWAGRGYTLAGSAGAFAALGPLRLKLAPEAFTTQNRPFELAPNGLGGEASLRDPRYPTRIDQPQRFGDGAYGRVDPGESLAALELRPITIGVTTGAQRWGPALQYPLVVGNNAGGFAHAFLGTREGVDLWLARLHGRWIIGRLEESDYSPSYTPETRRYATAVVVALEPRGARGLEIGVGRWVEGLWPLSLETALRPLSGIFAIRRAGDEGPNILFENQLASVFFRWSIPGGGIEVYGEYMKEDFGRDSRQYLTDPDDLGARVFGIQKVVALDGGHLLNLRGEVVSAELHHSERGDRAIRDPVLHPWSRYTHDELAQGHTQVGQILGSPTAYGGSGFTVGGDLYHPRGRWTVELLRMLRLDWYPGYAFEGDGVADILYGLRLERLLFRDGADLRLSVAPIWELNRNLVDHRDAFNLNVVLGMQGLPW